ncbi:MAG: AmmeMemoRadiSam system protein A [Spirochaetaceae bacterium]|nr:AmmeMemoRadiSam system protein A [Spirochaetaceae bacterium]
MEFIITDEEKKILLESARETIASKLAERKAVYGHTTKTLETKCGAFVTLHKHGQLRGCIGNLIGVKPLYNTIRDMAIASAFEDPRFMPLSKKELEEIDIEISVLSPLVKIKSIDEIKIGEHGILIKRGFRSGTFLPQVAVEQKWDVNELLENVCFKAGMDKNSWKAPDTELFVYSAIVFGEK